MEAFHALGLIYWNGSIFIAFVEGVSVWLKQLKIGKAMVQPNNQFSNGFSFSGSILISFSSTSPGGFCKNLCYPSLKYYLWNNKINGFYGGLLPLMVDIQILAQESRSVGWNFGEQKFLVGVSRRLCFYQIF